MKSQLRGLLGERLRQLDPPYKAFNQELDHFPKQGFRTIGTNCEYWWINAEYFRSLFSNRRAEVEAALRLLFDAGRLVLPVVCGTDNFPGVAYVESHLKWNKRARKKTGFYKIVVSSK
ncbi:hypothetical protein SAMN05519103_06372 [Rhizobiales bacterium GAS113]|nr:hypothetical protein SAMN05519103_06372 [Rhizobiales bacterium GAS113]